MLSIVMAVYNEKESDLRTSIESILNQSYKEFEFIIVIDNIYNLLIMKIVNEYKNYDRRIKVIINKENIGLGASLDKAIRNANSDLIVRMDADDIAYSSRLEVLVSEIKADDDLVFSRYQVINEDGEFIKESGNVDFTTDQIYKKLWLNNFICHPSVIFKKSSYLKVGGYSDIRVSEDIDLWIRMSKMQMKIRGIENILMKYRIRADSMTTSNYFRTHFAKKYIRKYYKKWDYVSKITNKEFQKEYKKNNKDIDKYNYYANIFELTLKNWEYENFKKYIIIILLSVRQPQLFSIAMDRVLSNFIKPNNVLIEGEASEKKIF